MHDSDYFTPEQQAQIVTRTGELGLARLHAVESGWKQLTHDLRAEMERGTAPDSPPARRLADRWKALVEEVAGGDTGIATSITQMLTQDEKIGRSASLDPALVTYAVKVLKSEG